MIALLAVLLAFHPFVKFTEAEYKELLARHKPDDAPAPAKVQKKTLRKLLRQADKRPNGTESRYVDDILRVTEGVEEYEFEAVTLKLGNGLTYTPDFMVVRSKGSAEWIEFHEVKGLQVWEDSIVKLKAAAAKFTFFTFYLAQWDGQQWTVVKVLA